LHKRRRGIRGDSAVRIAVVNANRAVVGSVQHATFGSAAKILILRWQRRRVIWQDCSLVRLPVYGAHVSTRRCEEIVRRRAHTASDTVVGCKCTPFIETPRARWNQQIRGRPRHSVPAGIGKHCQRHWAHERSVRHARVHDLIANDARLPM
jgi:hypothetical protein